MADETIESAALEQADGNESVSEAKSVDEAGQTDETQEKEAEQKEEGPSRESTIAKIGKLFKSFGGSKEEAPEADDSDPEQGDLIPDDFVAAAVKAGWDDDTIIKFSSDYSDDELKEMVADLTTEERVEPKVEEQKEEEKPQPDSDVVQALNAKLQALEDKLSRYEQQQEHETVATKEQQAAELFDKLDEEFGVFGRTEKLKFPDGRYIASHPAVRARIEVWRDAVLFEQAGSSWGKALNRAISLYKGEHLERQVHEKVVKGLKANEKRLTARRTNKAVEKVFESEEDRKAAVVTEAMRKAGMEID